MPFNFPDAPTVGQVFPVSPGAGIYQYTWDGEKWTMGDGGSIVPPVDTTAPILSSPPIGGETGPTTASYVVTTNEGNGNIYWVAVLTAAVPPLANNILFGQDGSGAPAVDSGNFPVTVAGAQAPFTPNGLTGATAYDVYVTHRDAASNNSNVVTDEFITSVADTAGPVIVSVSPVDNATSVSLTTNLVITWDEPVFLPAGGASFRLFRIDGTLIQTWNSAGLGTTWTISGAVTTFVLAAPLANGTEYYVLVAANSVEDAAGNDGAAIVSTTAWSFTTVVHASPSLSLYAGDDTGTVGDDETETENPDLDVSFNGVTTVTGGKLYIRVGGVVENIDGVGYHALTAPEAGGGNITLTGMTDLVAPGVYDIEGKYETSAWGTLYQLTVIEPVVSNTLLTNLVSYYKLDEASGGATDAHGTNHLTAVGTIGTGTGIIGGARDFEATDLTDGLVIADNASLSMGDIDFTLQAWVHIESKGDFRNLVVKSTGPANYEFGLAYNSAADRFEFYVSSTGNVISATLSAATLGSPAIATWYHLVARHNATTNLIKLTINDVAETSVAHSGGIFDGAGEFSIGQRDVYYTSSPMDGLIDEVAVWKRELSDAEITMLYNAGAGFSYDDFE